MIRNVRPLCLGSPRFPESVQALPDSESRWHALILAHGPAQAAALVEGDFAVALDLPDGSIFLAVDRFAIRTLCYRMGPAEVFISERADECAVASGDLDLQALFDYLYFHVIPSPRTVFNDVGRLPPGCFAVLQRGHMIVERYWIPDFKQVKGADFSDLKTEFQGLLSDAVSRQLDGSRPACFLSGGTDSSTVAGMLSKTTGQKVTAYSIGFEAEGYDEMAYARLAAKHFGCEHREYYVTADDLVRDIPMVAGFYDQPFGNSSALPSFQCAKQARADGVSRLLAGDGGDELFGGNTRYATQRLFSHYQRVPAPLRRGVMEPFFSMAWVKQTPLLKRGSGYIRQANTPLPDRAQAFNLLDRLGFGQVLTPGFLGQIDAASVLTQQQQVWAQARCDDEINRYLAYDWRYTLAECDLPKVCGTTSMAGLSVGFPMLDDALLAFSMRLPAEYKLKGKQLRWFFKEALRGFLPDEILTKKKQGFGLPFGVWVVKNPGLRQLADDALNSLSERGLIQPSFLRQLVDHYLPAHPHYYGTMVWILVMLEHWLRAHAPSYRLQA